METNHTVPRERYDRLVREAQCLPPVITAVVHPCDRISIEGVVDAAKLGLIAPILVGPPARIRDAAQQAEADVSSFPIEATAHSHDSAAKAVELVRQGKAEALMKGSLHTDELMGAVVARETGIRTARRISHCFIMDVPGHKDPLIITDAAVNIAPSLADKVDIVQNGSISAMRWASRRCAWRSCRQWKPSIPQSRRQLKRPHCAKWRNADRSPAGFWMAPWRSTTRLTRRLRQSSTSSRQ
jgi:Phosphate acetyl/butaryl transferase